LLLLTACTKEESAEIPEEPAALEKTKLLSVTIPNNYYLESGDTKYSGFVYLTNNKGELITKGELKNNSTLELSEVYSLSENTLNATFIYKIEIGELIAYRISTYNDIDPYDLTFIEAEIRSNGPEAIVKLTNTGNQLKFFAENFTTLSVHTTQNNAEFEIGLKKVPDNLYFSLQKQSEDFRRYVLLKNVDGNTNESLDFNNLPMISEPLKFSYPENDYVFTSITGSNEETPNDFYAVFESLNSREGITSHEFYIPQDVFQLYNVLVSFTKDGVSYSSTKKSSDIDLNYKFPTDFDFQFSMDSNSSYNLTTTGTSDYYNLSFNYFDENGKYDIKWVVSGESKATINFSLPNLEQFIQEDFPNFSISELKINSAGLSRIQGVNTYKEFVLSGADENYSRNDLISSSEYLSKQINP